MPTGCTDLDDLALGLDIARAASLKHQLTSGLFSLGMSCKELHMRLLSVEGPVALTTSAPATSTTRPGPAWPKPKPGSTPATCSSRLKQRGHLGPVVIDYLQLLQYGGGRRPESRQQEVSGISRQLKLMAKELEIPVIVLSQVHRGPEQRTDKGPQVSDLRESGSLEQDADVVIHQYEKESPRAGEADLIVGKHRSQDRSAGSST